MTLLSSIRLPSRRVLLCIYALCILWLSLDPSPPVPENAILGWDKFQHAFAYAFLTFLAGIAWSPVINPYRRWLFAAVSAIAYGGLLELLQGWCTQGRVAEFSDLLADAAGAALVVTVALTVPKLGAGKS